MGRPTLHETFMQTDDTWSRRATCARAHVGCVLARDDRVLTTGYNGSPPGLPHCDDVGHDMVDFHCIRTIHAEENSIICAAKHGLSTERAVCYTTMHPCIRCVGRIFTAGIRTVIYRDVYSSMADDDKGRLKRFEEGGLIIRDIKEIIGAGEFRVRTG